jgi:hypothetical protein
VSEWPGMSPAGCLLTMYAWLCNFCQKRKRKKSTFCQIMMGRWGDGSMLLLVPCTIYIILDSIFIVAEYQTKLVKKRLSHNMSASVAACCWHPCCQNANKLLYT